MKIAFIGAGWVAGQHLQYLVGEPNIEVVGHVSPIQAERETAVKHWGGRGYSDTATLLQHETVDAVWICVPPHQHGDIERQLLARKIPMFIEKPLSADRATAVELATLIEQSGLVVAVGYHWRAVGALNAVKASLAQNPARMVTGRWHDATPPPAWWRKQATSGGQMVEQATHVIDLARTLLGDASVKAASASQQPRVAFPDMDVDVVSAALLQFPNHVPGVFSATCLLGGAADVDVQLYCEGLLITITRESVIFDDGKTKREEPFGINPFLTEDRAFIQAILTGDKSLLYCSYADALVTHQLCHNILEASHTK
jgi:predicted dehydrogenase